LNCTVPVAGEGAIVAVNVIGCRKAAGLGLDVTATDDGTAAWQTSFDDWSLE
jgi:hypothetical protein